MYFDCTSGAFRTTSKNKARGARATAWVLLFVVTFSAFAAPAVATQDPKKFVDALAGEAFATLRDETISETQRFNEFRTLLSKGVDLKRVGRFVLGVHWRRANPAQRAEYEDLFGDYVIASYAGRLKEYSDSTVRVKGSVSSDRGEHLVTTMISQPSAVEPIRVDWRVRESGDQLQIIDIIIEGISMAISQRSEFASVIQSNGGDMSTLLARLRKVTGSDSTGDQVNAVN